jgi:glutaredoxin-like YruB-family protein
MRYTDIHSLKELIMNIEGLDRAYLLLYKENSDLSICAIKNIEKAAEENPDIKIFKANVATVRDIHPKYSVTSVPTLITFEKGEFKNLIKGCNESSYYKSIFESLYSFSNEDSEGKPAKNVTVYSAPSCSWCNTLKTHLRKNGIRFRDVDVSRDPSAAEDLVRRTGQQGVPQTDINGEIIVGFDKTRINRLLEIKG